MACHFTSILSLQGYLIILIKWRRRNSCQDGIWYPSILAQQPILGTEQESPNHPASRWLLHVHSYGSKTTCKPKSDLEDQWFSKKRSTFVCMEANIFILCEQTFIPFQYINYLEFEFWPKKYQNGHPLDLSIDVRPLSPGALRLYRRDCRHGRAQIGRDQQCGKGKHGEGPGFSRLIQAQLGGDRLHGKSWYLDQFTPIATGLTYLAYNWGELTHLRTGMSHQVQHILPLKEGL